MVISENIPAFGRDVNGKAGSEITKALPFSNASVILKPSWIKQRKLLNIQYIKALDPERLLHNFRVNAGLSSNAKPLKGWEAPTIGLRGHFVGHYLSAVSDLIEKYKDTLLTNRLNYRVGELYKCQQRSATVISVRSRKVILITFISCRK
jgi:DUF1680 family protein